MYYKYDPEKSIHIPKPFQRVITPVFMGDDEQIRETNFSVHFTEWAPGCEVDSHSHEASMEAMYCISGVGIAEVDHTAHEFVPGAMIVAPPGIQHKIINTGTETLRVFCIFSPPTTEKELRNRALGAVEAEKEE